ncbi:hypothetical protein P3S68_013740 [Capsicum galapagoense]
MEGTDEISKLPEPILDHILSFLAIKDAAKTSTLSKVWNSSKNIVDQILSNRLNQKISIKRFKANLPIYLSKAVDDWIKVLVTCNIKELFLDIGVYTYNKSPEAIFAAKSLNVLSLRGFELERIKFYFLRELYLEDSSLDEQFLQALCAICSDLEVLSLKRFSRLISLQVAGTFPKLRTVKLQTCPPKFRKVDIVAPNIVKISSCRVKVLKVVACYHLIAVDLDDAPNLLRFSYDIHHGKKGLVGYFDPSPTFKLKASRLLEVEIKLIPDPEALDTRWYSKLTESLGNFNNSTAITLRCDYDQVRDSYTKRHERKLASSALWY